MPDRAKTELQALAKMIRDFCEMGSGEFKHHYPDYGFAEGVVYLDRKAREAVKRASPTHGADHDR